MILFKNVIDLKVFVMYRSVNSTRQPNIKLIILGKLMKLTENIENVLNKDLIESLLHKT